MGCELDLDTYFSGSRASLEGGEGVEATEVHDKWFVPSRDLHCRIRREGQRQCCGTAANNEISLIITVLAKTGAKVPMK